MKKIEHILFWLVLILLFFCASKYGSLSTDVEIGDTYYIIANSQIAGIFSVWLLVVVLLFKLIRRRRQAVNKIFAGTYIALTTLLLGLFLGLGLVKGGSAVGTFNTAQLDALLFRNQLKIACAEGCLGVQVIFLIYFVTQMVKKPAPGGA